MLYAMVIVAVNFASAQKTFQIFLAKLGHTKKFEFYCGDKLSFKFKHQRGYHTHRITNMRDSLILLGNDSVINISDIKAVKFKRGNNAMGRLAKLFPKGAVGIIVINLLSNILVAGVAKIDPKAMYISGGFVLGYIIFQMWNTKRIRINRNVTIKVLDPVYNKLKL
jgi:hypothetical protein